MYDALAKRVLNNMLSRARQCWEQGIMGMALYELGEEELFLSACDDMLTRQNTDGRLCTVGGTHTLTDPALCIQSVIHAWNLTKDDSYHKAAEKNLAFLKSTDCKTNDGILYHIIGRPELWSDSAAMLPASLAAMNETEMAYEQITGLCAKLKLENGLYGHRWNDQAKNWVRKQPWAAGNGWILTGLAWTMRYLGKEDERTYSLLCIFNNLCEALHPYRTANGLYHNIVDDANSFEECQTAAAQAYSSIIVYEIGLSDKSVLMNAANTLREISKHVDGHGAIHDCAGSPDFDHNGTSTEMQAYWLMLYAALKRNNFEE